MSKLVENIFDSNKSYNFHKLDIKIKLKDLLNTLIKADRYDLGIDIISLIENNQFINIHEPVFSEEVDKQYQIEIWVKVKKIIIEQLEIEESMIKANSNLSYDLGCAELDFIHLIMSLEEEFDVDLEINRNINKTERDINIQNLYDIVLSCL
ncbi:MAG: phosphopantetheine-binding protein [Waterburya sp.]